MEVRDTIFSLQQVLCETSDTEELSSILSSNVSRYLTLRQKETSLPPPTLTTIPYPTSATPETGDFVFCCVDSLKLLSSLTLPSLPDLVISVTNQNTLVQVLQMLAGFGISLLCDPGVCPVSVNSERFEQCPVQRNLVLQEIIVTVRPLISDNYFGSLILNKNLGVLIGALVNILYGPNNPSRIMKQNKSDALVRKSEQINGEDLKSFLDDLLYKAPNAVTEIISLQLPKGSTKPPMWLLAVTNDLMRLQVTRPNGVINVTRSLFEHYGKILAYEDQSFCDKISEVIITPPRRQPEDYVTNIIEQAAEMLEKLGDGELRTQYLRLYKNIVHKLTAEYPERMFDLFWCHIFRPCVKWRMNDQIVVREKEIETWLIRLKTISSLGVFHNKISDRLNDEFLLSLLHLFHHSIQGISPKKAIIETIISEMMASSRCWSRIFMQFLSTNLSESRNVIWAHGDTGGLILISSTDDSSTSAAENLSLDPNDILGGNDRIVEVCLKLMKTLPPDRNDQLSEFFLDLFRSIITDVSPPPTDDNFLDCQRELCDFQSSLRKGMLLDQMCQTFGQKLLKDTTQTIELLKMIILQKSECPGPEKDELLLLSFGILSTYLREEIKLSAEDETEIKSLMDPLSLIKDFSGNAEVSAMANDLRICIATKINIESLPSFGSSNANVQKQDSLSDIIRDLADPLIPSRAHAIIQLGKRFTSKDPLVIENVGILQKILMDNLSHDDSYIFLAAVKCLSQMSWHNTQLVLDLIVTEIHNVSRKEDDRAKCMEVLVSTMKITNELLPRYVNQIFNCLARCVSRQESEILRASSLSNIAELCVLCKFAILTHIQEIIDICEKTLLEDESPLAKMGAITIIANFIESQDKSLFHESQSETLRIYRLLKRVSNMSTTPAIHHRTLQALGVLSGVVREFMFPKIKIKHEVKIL